MLGPKVLGVQSAAASRQASRNGQCLSLLLGSPVRECQWEERSRDAASSLGWVVREGKEGVPRNSVSERGVESLVASAISCGWTQLSGVAQSQLLSTECLWAPLQNIHLSKFGC